MADQRLKDTRLRVALEYWLGGAGQRHAMDLSVTDPAGNECRGPEPTMAFHGAEVASPAPWSSEAFLPADTADWHCGDPRNGPYTVTVIGTVLGGEGTEPVPYRVRAKLEKPALEPANPKLLLPNLVADPPPWDVELECLSLYDPRDADGADRQCLRFSFGYGNIGEGMLDIHFSSLASTLDGRGNARQRVYYADATPGDYADNYLRGPGSGYEDYPDAGAVEFHDSHHHWHYNDFYDIELFAVEAGGDLGEPRASKKRGLCTTAWYMVDFARFFHDPADAAASSGCDVGGMTGTVDPVPDDLRIPLPAGWGDVYPKETPAQFVEIHDLPDGEYILRVTLNPRRKIRERNVDDNSGYAHLRFWTEDGERRVCILQRGSGGDPWDAAGTKERAMGNLCG